jgi:dTDP-glucose 4,6-dehydratase
MLEYSKTIIITGGAGFIGSHVVRLFVTKYPEYKIINLDALTYAGNLENLKDIEDAPNYVFEKVNILNIEELDRVFETYQPDGVIHLAAESHVDRSILSPLDFVHTNIIGTVNLLNAAKKQWLASAATLPFDSAQGKLAQGETGAATLRQAQGDSNASATLPFDSAQGKLAQGETGAATLPFDSAQGKLAQDDNNAAQGDNRKLFYHVSTDEVYGALGETGFFTEETPYHPNSPYSASKAASDHFVRAYGETYGLPFVISNCSNNYGPNHFPEKLIPLFINNIINKKPLPVYGDGLYTRDWLFVKDHAAAIDLIYHKGKNEETYNIGGFNEWKNIDLVKLLCQLMDEKLNRKKGESEQLITYIKDRPGHDRRYAIDATKINKELGWKPSVTFEQGLSQTIDWYLQNTEWLEHVTSGAYQKYYEEMYENN